MHMKKKYYVHVHAHYHTNNLVNKTHFVSFDPFLTFHFSTIIFHKDFLTCVEISHRVSKNESIIHHKSHSSDITKVG